MGEMVQLHAKDSHTLDAYAVQPGEPATAGLVIVQEIFGVNAHIRVVAERYADEGFVTIAPALFDRVEKGVDLGYEGDDMQRAMRLLNDFKMEKAVDDIAAGVEWLRSGTKNAVVSEARATPKLIDICCMVLAIVLAMLVLASGISA